MTVRGASGERTMTRRAGAPGSADVWVRPGTPDTPDQTFGNFVNHVQPLAFSSFEPTVSIDSMQFLVRIDYGGEAEAPIGFLELYRVAVEQPGVWDYYLQTEATRIPARPSQSRRTGGSRPRRSLLTGTGQGIQRTLTRADS